MWVTSHDHLYIHKWVKSNIIWFVNVEFELLQVIYLFLVSISLSTSSLEKYKYFWLSWYTCIVLGKWIQISSFAFFQIPELFFCYIYVYCENFEINIVLTNISARTNSIRAHTNSIRAHTYSIRARVNSISSGSNYIRVNTYTRSYIIFALIQLNPTQIE